MPINEFQFAYVFNTEKNAVERYDIDIGDQPFVVGQSQEYAAYGQYAVVHPGKVLCYLQRLG